MVVGGEDEWWGGNMRDGVIHRGLPSAKRGRIVGGGEEGTGWGLG